MSFRRDDGSRPHRSALPSLPKTPTGIVGLDEITNGGLPTGRTTLICGSAGSGKTLFAVEFLVRGATQHREPGVLFAFEETAEDLAENVASLGFNLGQLAAKRLLAIDHILIDRSEIQETGEYSLDGLFVRLGAAIDSIGARRVVIDTPEALFAGFENQAILRSELARLFRWLKTKGVTAIVTGERGDGTLTRNGLEEYVSDCVIQLDHQVKDQISTRRLRIVKYRGSTHGTNDYPFLINEGGISVLPITSLGLYYEVSAERISTGIAALDEMLDGKGYFRGSSVLVSGGAGTGKTSLAASFADATCRHNETCLYVALEESTAQIRRNMRSIGIDLERWIRKKRLVFSAARPTFFGLEMHLITIHKLIDELAPSAVIVDPISSLLSTGSPTEVKSMMVRLLDFLKTRQITALLTSLTPAEAQEDNQIGVSSLIDTWLQVRDLEAGGERTRTMCVIKSRGMRHSKQVREFRICDHGIELLEVPSGPSRDLAGPASGAAPGNGTTIGHGRRNPRPRNGGRRAP